MTKGLNDEVMFIADLGDWSDGFCKPEVDGNSFPWVWDDAGSAAHTSSAFSSAALPSAGAEPTDAQDRINDDVAAPIHAESHDGSFSNHAPDDHVPDTAPVGNGEGAAPTDISLGPATSVLPLVVAAHPAVGPAVVPMTDLVGISYGTGIAASANAAYQVFITGTAETGASAAAPAHAAAVEAVTAAAQQGSSDFITDASVGSQGATAVQVQQALDESGLSVNGAGIKVGVLSDSFNDLGGASADEADGALPSASNVQVLADISSGGTDEGRAMMQIVHDIASGSSLAFYTADESEQSFANGILALAAAGCKVICDDVSYYDEPFFGGGVIAQAIATVEAEGVTYITSAGNDASNAYQAAWTPDFSGSFDGYSFVDVENFGGSIVKNITVSASASEPVPLLLEWNQAYGAATADLALYVFQNGHYVGSATNRSVGEPSNPWTGLELTSSGTYQIVIDNLSSVSNSDPTLFKLIAAGDGLPVTISGANAGTVFGHAMTPGVITAGAVSAADTPAFGFSTPVSESFSSSGAGSELLYSPNGTPLSSPELINPVAVSGVDDISTTVSGGLRDFYGTSAASASLAGVAALILAANPNLTPAQVEQVMEETATPMANSAVSGAGLVNVDAAVAAATALIPDVIEASGSTSLVEVGTKYFLDAISSGSGPELVYQGAPVLAGQFGSWTPIGAEQISGGDYEVAWRVPGTDEFQIWTTDSNGNYLSGTSVIGGTSTTLEAAETVFHQDLNGDGTTGAATTNVIEAHGSTQLVVIGNDYYLDAASTGYGPEFQYHGSPVTVGEFGNISIIGAEQLSGGGYEVALHVTGADQYTVWDTDSNGDFVSNATGGIFVSGTSATLESLETSFQQDLNGDGTVGPAPLVIDPYGSTLLVETGGYYYFDPAGGGTGPEFQYHGSPVTVGGFGNISIIGAEQLTGGGYEVALQITGTNQYTIWDTDSSGRFLSNATGGAFVSGTSATLESLETSFHQDLNGDGTVGLTGSVTEAYGSTSLVQLNGNYYFVPVGGGVSPEFQYHGSPVTVGEFGNTAIIGAEQLSGGGYEVALHVTGADQYTVWDTDSNGSFVSNATGGVFVSGTSAILESLETNFQQDLNGDGTIGPAPFVVASHGSTSLVEMEGNYYFDPVGGGAGPEFQYHGSPVTVGEFGNISIIGAQQLAGGGYEVALQITGTDQYTIWDTDSSGNFVSNATGGTFVSGTSATLESLEPSFHQDLNGDGTVGLTGSVTEAYGSTSLVQLNGNYYFVPVGGGVSPEFQYHGSPVTVGEFGNTAIIGAEQLSGGGYEVALHVTGADQYTVWDTDSNGSFVSNATGGVFVSGTSAILESLETSFHQDLNGDGTIGSTSSPGSAVSLVASSSASAAAAAASDSFVFSFSGGASSSNSGTTSQETFEFDGAAAQAAFNQLAHIFSAPASEGAFLMQVAAGSHDAVAYFANLEATSVDNVHVTQTGHGFIIQ